MKPQVRNILIGIAIAVVAYFAWQIFMGEDAETEINHQLDRLEEIALKTGKETTFQSFGSAKKAAGFVIEKPYIELLPGMRPIDSRDSLAGALTASRGRVDTLEVNFTNRSIDVADSGDRALVLVRASAKGQAFGEKQSYSAKYRMEWEEVDGEWLIVRVERLDD